MQIFHMREIVRVAEAETVIEWRIEWRARATALLESLGLTIELETATDPFFGRAGRLLAAHQRGAELKWELLAHVAGERPTAIASSNYHQDHFGLTYSLMTAGRRTRTHGLHGVRRGARHAGAVQRARPGSRQLARRGALEAGAVGLSMEPAP